MYSKSKKHSSKKRIKFSKKSKSCKKSIIKIEKKVRKLEKEQELKHITAVYNSYDNGLDTAGGANAIAFNNPYVKFLNGCVRGTSYVQRVGDTIRVTSIDIRGQVFVTPPITNIGGFDIPVRLMLVRFKRPEGQNMLLYAPNPISAGVTPLFSKSAGGKYPYTWEQMDPGILSNPYFQYKILYNKVHRLRNNVAWYNGTNPQSINPYFNFHINKKINSISDYSRGTAGTVADVEANSYFFICITDSNQALTCQYNSVVYFKDA